MVGEDYYYNNSINLLHLNYIHSLKNTLIFVHFVVLRVQNVAFLLAYSLHVTHNFLAPASRVSLITESRTRAFSNVCRHMQSPKKHVAGNESRQLLWLNLWVFPALVQHQSSCSRSNFHFPASSYEWRKLSHGFEFALFKCV